MNGLSCKFTCYISIFGYIHLTNTSEIVNGRSLEGQVVTEVDNAIHLLV
jgi:hypothetical protein